MFVGKDHVCGNGPCSWEGVDIMGRVVCFMNFLFSVLHI